MDTFAALAHGMAVAMQPMNLLYALIGVFLGTAVGVLPGIGPALTVALLLPVTYKLDPGGSLIMFAGIYYGGMYGGSTTAILINTPGESASMATALEGNKMAKAGRGGPALATSAIAGYLPCSATTTGTSCSRMRAMNSGTLKLSWRTSTTWRSARPSSLRGNSSRNLPKSTPSNFLVGANCQSTGPSRSFSSSTPES